MASLARGEGRIYRGPGVALAQFDLMKPETPAPFASATYTVVADSRLDNRAELLHTFGWSGRDRTNEELILEAYRRWGERCPERLLGDFAFAVWDDRKRQLFCARDHLGIKPLYYWHDGATFCFASDLEGLLAFGKVAPKLDLRYLKAYLLYNQTFVSPHNSFFGSVHKLPAGHALSWRAGSVRLSRYWSPADAPPVALGGDDAYFEHLRLLLAEAVRCRLDAYPPVATHLSSGLDSGAVTVLAARALSERLTTFSWSFPGDLSDFGLAHDERADIRDITEAENVEVNYTELSEADILGAFHDLTRTPQVHQATENAVLLKARALGFRSLLSGWGGDEGVSYYGRAYLSGLLRQGRLAELFTQLRGSSRAEGVGVFYRGLKRAVGLNVPEPLRRRYDRFWAPPALLPSLLSREFRNALDRVDPYPWHDYLIGCDVRTDQTALLTRGQITQRTEAWAAQATRQGMAYTYPLLDKRVVEFALGVPAGLYFRNGQNRYLFRGAMTGILPDSVRLKTLKRDPALEDPYYALLDAIIRKRTLLEVLEGRRGALEASGVLDVPRLLESVASCRSFRAYMDHPSGVSRALWLAFLDPETFW